MFRHQLEENFVTISRAQNTVKYPANFILIGAMNPCPCGFLGDRQKRCICSAFQIQRYKSKLSGPLLDRLDLHITVPRLTDDELLNVKKDGEASFDIRKRVIKARQIQLKRYAKDNIYTNSELTPKLINKYCQIDEQTKQMLKNAVNKFNLSARSYDRILKISRTIADLEESADISPNHAAQALMFRSLS